MFMMKSIPNYISLSRIIFSLMLLFFEPLGSLFYVIYLLCGCTDILDGYIARRTETTSSIGEKLDSFADIVFVVVLIYVLHSFIEPSKGIIIWIISIGIIRLVSIFVSLKKYKTFSILHTYGNKATGIILFLFPMSISYSIRASFMFLVCGMATISALEELLIQLTSKELQANRKSIFVK